MTTQIFSGTLTVIQCCKCHAYFGIPGDMEDRLRGNKGTFYCPAGHPQAFVESEIDRLKRQIVRQGVHVDQLKASVEWERSRANAAGEREERQRRCAIAQKAAKTRLKNRVANGVCICCNRFFKDLARHMKSEHPDATSKPDEADQLPSDTPMTA